MSLKLLILNEVTPSPILYELDLLRSKLSSSFLSETFILWLLESALSFEILFERFKLFELFLLECLLLLWIGCNSFWFEYIILTAGGTFTSAIFFIPNYNTNLLIL